MRSSGRLRDVVGSLHASGRVVRSDARGFTLLEVQVASIVFVLAIFFLIGQARVYRVLLDSVEEENALGGVAVEGEGRVVASVVRAGAGSAAPECVVRLESLGQSGGALGAELTVERRTP